MKGLSRRLLQRQDPVRRLPGRGFSLAGSKSPQLQERDYADLAAYGANLARIGVNVLVQPDGSSFGVPEVEWAYMDTVVAMGARYGFKVVIALQPNPWGQAESYWDSPALKASLTNIWASIAARYQGNPVIAGYDLINEPVMPKDRNLPSGPPIDYWTPLATQLIQAIRDQDPASIVIVEPSPWGLPKGFAAVTPLPFERVVYSFHFYEPHGMTHQGS